MNWRKYRLFTAQKYLLPQNLEEAWNLNQSKSNKIVGGMLWLKMSKKRISTIIDLSALGLDTIEENEEEFKIGAMCTLRQLEEFKGFEKYYGDLLRVSVESIVGIQFRNLATVGGSVYSRFGFSDVLTALMSLDSYVELYKGGRVSLKEYVQMPYDRDILVNVIIKKKEYKTSYQSFRITATDFPVLACAVTRNQEGAWKVIYGARPGKALEINNSLSGQPDTSEIEELIKKVKSWEHFESNMRGSKEYRKALAGALLNKAIKEITGKAGA